MADRRVVGTTNGDGERITEICGEWGTQTREDAIREIETGARAYYVEESGVRTSVRVVEASGEKQLETVSDSDAANHLTNLPDC